MQSRQIKCFSILTGLNYYSFLYDLWQKKKTHWNGLLVSLVMRSYCRKQQCCLVIVNGTQKTLRYQKSLKTEENAPISASQAKMSFSKDNCNVRSGMPRFWSKWRSSTQHPLANKPGWIKYFSPLLMQCN